MTRSRLRKSGTLASAGVLVSAGLFGAYVGNPRLQRAYATTTGCVSSAGTTSPAVSDDTTFRAALLDPDCTTIQVDGVSLTVLSNLPTIGNTEWAGPREAIGLTIAGVSLGQTIIDGGGTNSGIRIAVDDSTLNLIVSSLTLTDFSSGSDGAAVSVLQQPSSTYPGFPYVFLEGSKFTNNSAVGSGDGGVVSVVGFSPTVKVRSSVFGGPGGTGNTSNSRGGAIYAQSNAGGSATVNAEGGVFEGNTAQLMGGAVYADDVNVSDSNVFSQWSYNSSAASSGGAIYATGEVTVTGNVVFRNNSAAAGSGGAISANGSLDDTQSTAGYPQFNYNQAAYGGALYLGDPSRLSYTRLVENAATKSGGAIFADDSVTLAHSTFARNDASTSGTHRGGAIYARGPVEARYSSLTGNDAHTGSDGAIYSKADVTLINSYLGSNRAAIGSGGVHAIGDVRLYFSTLYNDDVDSSSDPRSVLATGNLFAYGSAVGVGVGVGSGSTYLMNVGGDVYSGFAVSTATTGGTFSGATNQNLAAGGLQLDSADGGLPGERGRPAKGSSPLLVGPPAGVYQQFSRDQLGVDRAAYTTYTIGARQFTGSPTPPLCSPTDDTVVVTGPTDDTLAAALGDANCVTIYVDGAIQLDADLPAITNSEWLPGLRDDSGLEIRGLRGPGDDTINGFDGFAHHSGIRVDVDDTNLKVTVSDVTLTRMESADPGGALSVSEQTPPSVGPEYPLVRLDNAILTGNYSDDNGGAVYVYGGYPQVHVNGSTFGGPTDGDGNRSDGDGGAIAAVSSPGQGSTVNVAGSQFVANYALGNGGAITANNVDISDGGPGTGFRFNSAIGSGGAIYGVDNGEVNLLGNVVFHENSAGSGGAIVARDRFSSDRTSYGFPVFTDNESSSSGGALYLNYCSGYAYVNFTVFAGNHAADTGGAIFNKCDAMYANYTTFEGNYVLGARSAGQGGAVFAQTGYLYFFNSSIVDNRADYGQAGAIFSNSYVTLENSYVGGNHAAEYVGAIYAYGARMSFSTVYDNSVDDSLNAPSALKSFYLTARGSAVGASSGSGYLMYVGSPGPIDDSYSVSTVSPGWDDSFTLNAAELDLAQQRSNDQPLTSDDTPGQGGKSPYSTSPLVLLSPAARPVWWAAADQLGDPRTPAPFTIGARQIPVAAVTVPTAPTITSANPGNGQVTINFTPPSSDGGAPITNYKYRLDSGPWVALSPSSTSSPVTIQGLENGRTYSVAILAVNSAGDGAPSAPVSVTPRSPFVPPTPTPTPSPVPVPPVPPGGSSLSVNGISVPVQVEPKPDDRGLDVTGPGFTMTLDGLGPDGEPLDLGPDDALVLDAERDVRTTGTGFAPGTQIGLFVDPPGLLKTTGQSWIERIVARAATDTIDLGRLTVAPDGTFAGTKTLPEGLTPGAHVLQAVGYGPGRVQRVLTLGIVVQPWIELDKGTRKAYGRYDRIRATGETGGITAGVRLVPNIRYTGQTSFARGRALISVQSDGTFRWTRAIKSSKGLAAYVSYVDVESNRVIWARVR